MKSDLIIMKIHYHYTKKIYQYIKQNVIQGKLCRSKSTLASVTIISSEGMCIQGIAGRFWTGVEGGGVVSDQIC